MSLSPETSSDSPSVNSHYRWLSLVLFGACFLAILFLYRDYGIIWDEPNHHSYGIGIVEYFSRGLDISIFPAPGEEAFTADNAFLLYGGLFDTLVAVAVSVFGGDGFETRHLVTALVGFVGIIGAWKLAGLFGGCRAAFIAAAVLILEPTYFGMMFNNPKDAPFATGYIWTVYLLIRSFEHLPRLSIGTVLALGLSIGWMTGIRVPGVLGLAYFGLAAAAYAFGPNWFSTDAKDSRPGDWLKSLVISGVGIGLVTYVLMLLCWPWAQQSPLVNPYEAYQAFSAFQFWNGFVLFDGTFTRAADLPGHYLPQYFLVKLPDLIVLTLGLGLVLGIYRLSRGISATPRLYISQHAFLVFSIVFPPTYAILTGAVIYDSIRHFLFIVPAICVAVGIVLHQLILLAERECPRLAPLALAVIGVSLCIQLWINVRLHPHQYVYYNSFAGGLAGRYETDYWANTYKEAVQEMVEHVSLNETEGDGPREYRVNICGPFLSASHYLPENFKLVPAPKDADFFIAFTRINCHNSVPDRVVASVTRMGVLPSVVKDLRPEMDDVPTGE